jgi:hypothetical protein
MPVLRIQAVWTGVTGLPGYSNHHFDIADSFPTATTIDAAATACRALYNNVAPYLPSAVQVNIRPTADVFDLSGVKLSEKAVATPGSAIVGSSVAAYAGGVGAVVHWKTGQYLGGRPLSGRTFLVPMAGAFDTTGTLSPAAQTAITNAANAMRNSAGSPPLVVWKHNIGGTSGFSPVSSITVPDRSAVLRSRRS